ncbi:condensation domain-containing protein, partial [Actinoplanes awajinensis]|uniref:condensation domain-containing protein n=1 Tax=Actinoplanes awajinensis TaxID=135946 RepID=UPI00373FD999
MLPLSFAQRRLWFLHRLEGPNATYNMPMALHLTGNLTVEALRSAVQDVVDRHESLRTVFPEIDGTPYQQILHGEQARIELPVHHIERERLNEELSRAAQYAFDLGRELPLRAVLFGAGGEHVLLLVLHHVAGDG